MQRLAYSLLLVIMCALALPAQTIHTVTGKYTFYGDRGHSREDCERLALEGARLKALADEFGTTLSQVVIAEDKIADGGEKNFFSSLSETEVKGEWIEDIGKPEYTYSLDADMNMMVTCIIKGRARAISNKAPEFTAAILRNGNDLKYADTRFRSGDDMKLYFKAPCDGYLVVYLVGDDRSVQAMLPYTASPDGAVKIKHGKEYVFYDKAKADPAHGEIDEIQLATDADVERDRFYILFSPNPFYKASDNYAGDLMPRSLPFNDFHKWLSKIRKADDALGQKTIDIIINK